MKWLKRLFSRRNKPRVPTKYYDQLFFYLEGGLDVDCETVDVEHVTIGNDEGRPNIKSVKFKVTRLIDPHDEMVWHVYSAWLASKQLKVMAQFGASGKRMKTEGSIEDLKFLSVKDEDTKMVYSIVCPAVDFQ
jgi:hypothetical protein